MDEFTAKMVFSIAFADEVRIIQELSEQLGVGVATEHYRSKYPSRPTALDPRSVADHFVVLRTALAEDRGALPRIRSIRHAVALRADPNLRSLREMLVEFHKSLQDGDANAVATARREVARAKRAMARRHEWQRALDWVTYLALPTTIAELLTGAPPIAGTSPSVLGATGAATVSRTKRRHSLGLLQSMRLLRRPKASQATRLLALRPSIVPLEPLNNLRVQISDGLAGLAVV